MRQIKVSIGHDDWHLWKGGSVDRVAINLDAVGTKVEVELELNGDDRDIDSTADSALFLVGTASSRAGATGFEVNLGAHFTDENEVGDFWEGRIVIFDDTHTNGRRFDDPFRIELVK